jgi:hypothetical protein
MIWKKEGRDYTCTNTLTPGTVDLAFHGDNDVQRLRVRRFGYSGVNLDVKPTDKEVDVALGHTYSSAFGIAANEAPDEKKLTAALKKEFEQTLLTDQEAFRCAPFELVDINVTKIEEARVFVLSVDIWLDRSFGGLAFRQASHAFNAQESNQKMGQVALDSGIAEIIGRFHRVAAKFPDVKDLIVVGYYSTTEARLGTEKTSYSSTQFKYHYVLCGQGDITCHEGTRVVAEPKTVTIRGENTVVRNQDAMGTIAFVMPTAQIPDTLDKKAITDAVLSAGTIQFERVSDKE